MGDILSGTPIEAMPGTMSVRNDARYRPVGPPSLNGADRPMTLSKTFSLMVVPALILAGSMPARASEEAKPTPPPVASGRPPLAGTQAPGKAATQAVTDPMAVPPSERAPGAGTTPREGGTAPSDVRR